jgi:hypothetical protein
MKEDVEGLSCGREDELVSFLYEEMDDVAARSFRTHMNSCRPCSRQLSAFANVRQSVTTWRNETLGIATQQPAMQFIADRQTRSAVAAVRQFFTLSPVWLKGAVAFASLLFCVLAVLVVVRLRETPSSPVVATPSQNRSLEEFNAAVEQRVQEELKRRETNVAAVPVLSPKHELNPRREIARQIDMPKSRRPLTKVERQELAADLRLIAGTDDLQVELLDDRINQ